MSLYGSLDAIVCIPGGQRFVNPAGGFLDQITFGQLIAGQRITGDSPEVAVVFTKRVFEEKRVGIELRLNLSELERLGLRERGITRIGFANGNLRPFEVVFKLADFLL